jgi:hypothetical protein
MPLLRNENEKRRYYIIIKQPTGEYPMKKRVMQIRLLSFLSLFGIIFVTGQATYGQTFPNENYSAFNWGFRLGLNALSTAGCDWNSEKIKLVNGKYQNKSGYGFHTFFRINLRRFFMQPELGWNLYKQEISFSSENPDHEETKISLKNNVVDINVLAGYSITKREAFSLNFICGTSFQYCYNTHFTTFTPSSKFQDGRPHFIPYGVIGFTIGISKSYFDIRYELNIIDTKIDFDGISNKPASLDKVSLRKSENILNFSCGLIF